MNEMVQRNPKTSGWRVIGWSVLGVLFSGAVANIGREADDRFAANPIYHTQFSFHMVDGAFWSTGMPWYILAVIVFLGALIGILVGAARLVHRKTASSNVAPRING